MANCNGDIAKNIALECSTPIEGGYTGRNILIPYNTNPSLTALSTNPRVITDITLAAGKKGVYVENNGTAPHGGSTTTGNADAGRCRYTKLHTILVPMRGADVAKDIIEPMVNSPQGFMLICEKKDKRGLGSYEIKGLQSPMKVDPATISRDEDANGGAISLTLTCTEDWEECNFFDEDYETTREWFDTFIGESCIQ